MTVFTLKLIAMASMICDHLGYWLFFENCISSGPYLVMRSLGRIAFPVFCFLIVNGYEHSSNRLRYLTRLTGFALLSQIPFTLVLTQGNYSALAGPLSFEAPSLAFIALSIFLGFLWYRFVSADASALLPALALLLGLSTLSIGGIYLLRPEMNVFYTLALSLACICVLDKFSASKAHAPADYAQAMAVLIALLLIWDRADYGIQGILLILILWLFRVRRWQQLLMLIIWAALQYPPVSGSLNYFICAALAAPLTALYRGRQGPPLKTAFYLVYPLHLSVLGLFGLI